VAVYRGNVGNLLQHWVLCEVLEAWRGCASQVNFIDAHSMAPVADERYPEKNALSRRRFDCVQARAREERTPYERAWHKLTPEPGRYPNSAGLLTELWPGEYSLVLCEVCPNTVHELRAWAHKISASPQCVSVEIAEGDWRNRFRCGLSASGDLALLSFDPYLFNRHGGLQNPGNMVPSDLDLIAQATRSLHGPLVMQLSTYSANGENAQPDVIEVVDSRLIQQSFERLAVVRADGHMMSMLYGRHLGHGPSLGDLPGRFISWLQTVKAECGASLV
jgi:hypothetical protein